MRYTLATEGLVFSTRDRGARVREELKAALGGRPASELTIDLGDVINVSYSFVDEFIGRWASELVERNAALPRFDNVPAQATKIIRQSLTRREIDASMMLPVTA